VYNVELERTPKETQFTARAVEGIRVHIGEESRADLQMIAGRRLQGTALDASSGKPLVGMWIHCYSASHPRSGTASQTRITDEHGHFEFFVPPGPAYISIYETQPSSQSDKTVNIPEGQDPDPIVLKAGAPRSLFPPGVPVASCEVQVRVKTNPNDPP